MVILSNTKQFILMKSCNPTHHSSWLFIYLPSQQVNEQYPLELHLEVRICTRMIHLYTPSSQPSPLNILMYLEFTFTLLEICKPGTSRWNELKKWQLTGKLRELMGVMKKKFWSNREEFLEKEFIVISGKLDNDII